MRSRGVGGPPAGRLESGKREKRPMFSVISHPAARPGAAPPEVMRCLFRRSCATSGGAASCRAMADGERKNVSRKVRQGRKGSGRRAGESINIENHESRFADMEKQEGNGRESSRGGGGEADAYKTEACSVLSGTFGIRAPEKSREPPPMIPLLGSYRAGLCVPPRWGLREQEFVTISRSFRYSRPQYLQVNGPATFPSNASW
jgi:hypothetical protein